MDTTTQNILSFELLINSFVFDCWSADTEMRYIYQTIKEMFFAQTPKCQSDYYI